MMNGWLNINEGSEYAGVSRDTFRDWMKEGLRHVRKGNLVRIKPEWIDDFLIQFEYKDDLDSIAKKIVKNLKR